MSLFDYQSAIQITFDKPITSDPEIITGSEYYKPFFTEVSPLTPISSGDNSSYPKSNAFDGDSSTFWRSSSTTAPQWIGRDYSGPVTLTMVQARFEYSSGRPNAFQFQGSDDGTNWYDVATGNFANASGSQQVTFASTTYRYWRLYFTSKYSSYFTCSELEFYNTRNTYSSAGWTVTGLVYPFIPGGAPTNHTFTVHKVTKSEDNLSVILWLDVADRMRNLAGPITVSYNQLLGNLRGAYDSVVASFSLEFEPGNITPLNNPHDEEHLSVLANLTVSVMEVTYRYIPAESDTFLVPDLDNPYMDENLSVLAILSVVVTKVGELPL